MTYLELFDEFTEKFKALPYADDGEIIHGIQSDIVDRNHVLDLISTYRKLIKEKENN